MLKNFTSLLFAISTLLILSTSYLSAQCDDAINMNGDMETADGNQASGYELNLDLNNSATGSEMLITAGGNSFTEFTITGGNYGNFYMEIPAGGFDPNAEHTFAADVTVTSATGSVQIAIEYFTDTGGYIAGDYGASISASDGMQRLTITATPATNGGASLSIMRISLNTTNATVQTDNFCLQSAGGAVDPQVDGCDGNLISNGTFTSNVVGWFSYGTTTFAYSATAGADGAGGATIGPDADYGMGQGDIPVTPGDTYLARAEIQKVSGGDCEMILKWKNGMTDVGQIAVPVTAGSYQIYEIPGTVPAGATSAEVLVTGKGQAILNIDNVCLLAGHTFLAETACPDNLTNDYGFENAGGYFDSSPWSCFANGCTGDNVRKVNDAASGFQAVRIEGLDAYNAAGIDFPATGGATYSLSVAMKRLGTTLYAQARIYWNDGTNEVIIVPEDIASNAGWADYTATAVAPATATGGNLRFEMGNTGFFLFDNVCLTEELPAPVTLTAFNGEVAGKTNKLSWTTATEENTAMFYVERSTNGTSNWEEVTTVNATGNSQTERTYATEDVQPLTNSYYRLRTVDFDGSEQLSDVILLTRTIGTDFVAYPNPFSNQLTLTTDLETATDYRLMDGLGRTLRQGKVAAGAQTTLIATQALPAGRYLIRVGERTIAVVK